MSENRAQAILLIDDDESFRFIVAQNLTQAGFKVSTAANGALATQTLLSGSAFDLILCDLKMPLHDGIEFLQTLKNENISTPVIIVTGYPEREKIIAAAKGGVTEVILKPVRGADLIKRIREKLARDVKGKAQV